MTGAEDRYPVDAGTWLKRKWAIHPSDCEQCGTRKSVCWISTATSEWWFSECSGCHPAESIETWKVKGDPIVAHVREVPALASSSRDAPDISVRTRGGTPMPAGVLMRVGDSFTRLARARRDKATNANRPRWRLEIRDDGRAWAPWDPSTSWGQRGAALPLRTGTIRRARQCACCKTEIDADAIVWRADTAAHSPDKSGRNTHRWSTEGLSLIWCFSCVAAVRTHEEAAPEETVVRHMRVIEGGQR